MITTTTKLVKRKIYKLCLINILLIDKDKDLHASKLKAFATINLETNKGDFKFTFKEDRRRTSKFFKRYIIEIDVPDVVNDKLKTLNNKLFVAIKLLVIPIDYTVLTEALYEVYIDKVIEAFEKGHI